MDERARRIGQNEALYRAVNEKIEDLNEAFRSLTDTLTVVCECGMLECAQQLELDVETYERVRSDPALFVVVPGHELEDVEFVVERTPTFNVIRKNPGEPERIARETDPRM